MQKHCLLDFLATSSVCLSLQNALRMNCEVANDCNAMLFCAVTILYEFIISYSYIRSIRDGSLQS